MMYVPDTNIISYWIKKDDGIVEHIKLLIKQGNEIIISPVTYYEIRRGFRHKAAPSKEFAFSLICKLYEIGEMNVAAWEEAADIYGKTRRVGTPIEDTDILIAAFCIVNNYTLMTNNEKHFKDIDSLTIINLVQ